MKHAWLDESARMSQAGMVCGWDLLGGWVFYRAVFEDGMSTFFFDGFKGKPKGTTYLEGKRSGWEGC